MPYKNKEKQKEYQRQLYQKNKEKYVQRRNDARKDRRRYVDNKKKKSQCKICGFKDYRALVYHHRDPSIKFASISNMGMRGFTYDKIEIEIEKCDLICANCHKIHNYKIYNE